MKTTSDLKIKRRVVFYLGGFDRRGVEFYHKQYLEQAGLQQSINQCEYLVSSLDTRDELMPTWQIHTEESKKDKVHTSYHWLQWDDLFEAHWPRSDGLASLQYLRFAWTHITTGTCLRVLRHAKQILPMILAPLLWFVMMVLLSIGVGVSAASLMQDGVANFGLTKWIPKGLYEILGGVTGLVVGLVVLLSVWRSAKSQRLFWLARGWVFVQAVALGRDQRFDARFKLLAEKIQQQILQTDADEYLLIGHCGGCFSAVSVLSHLQSTLSKEDTNSVLALRMQKLHLLTLAQIISVLALIPQARQFRSELLHVARGSVPWYDLASPADPLCCGLVGPLSGVVEDTAADGNAIRQPLTRSARFDRMWSAERYRAIRRHAFVIHFQYLMATEQPVFNDYFSLTAGSLALQDRWRMPS
ncbi:hypothetical protein [Variovorax sp. PCZ-1]|uniref:hypothetical protein n=1 Tax=Variovorax sp. PCZ-1 TaxID=2835533 RepID=UPI001BD107D1|nr:hypothetical protein [Variovorax sp. PCZ-1]MBS7807763.1 hypothetical protein [Variovorax sp. PCZ-1]